MTKLNCKKCKKETNHLEDIETYIHNPYPYIVYICKTCWNIRKSEKL